VQDSVSEIDALHRRGEFGAGPQPGIPGRFGCSRCGLSTDVTHQINLRNHAEASITSCHEPLKTTRLSSVHGASVPFSHRTLVSWLNCFMLSYPLRSGADRGADSRERMLSANKPHHHCYEQPSSDGSDAALPRRLEPPRWRCNREIAAASITIRSHCIRRRAAVAALLLHKPILRVITDQVEDPLVLATVLWGLIPEDFGKDGCFRWCPRT
jgi:hypothetical protein